jgi:hypothetical protein
MPTGVYERTPEHRRKLSETHKRIGSKPPRTKYWLGKKGDPRISGENHNQWKGDNVGYPQLHKWARKQFGNPRECWLCGATGRIEMANINGVYTKSGGTWAALCVRHHRLLDKHPFYAAQ